MTPELIKLIARRFRILAEPARLSILNALRDGERTVTELIAATGLNQANVSRHLQLLRDADFVVRRKDGQFAHYRISDPAVERLCEIMCERLEERAHAQQAIVTSA